MVRKKAKEFYSELDQIADSEAFIESIQEGYLNHILRGA